MSIGSTQTNHQDISLEEVYVHQGKRMMMLVPEKPLAEGSVMIRSTQLKTSICEWKTRDNAKAYKYTQKLIERFEQMGIFNYMIIAKEVKQSDSPFAWEVVPYPQEGWKYWKQFKVLAAVIFGGSTLSISDRGKIRDNLTGSTLMKSPAKAEDSFKIFIGKPDYFCDDKVIGRQLVHETARTNILQDLAPLILGEKGRHLLLIPKQHCLKFSELSKQDYLDLMETLQMIVRYYQDEGFPIVYIFTKTGEESGQTVGHLHIHVVFAASEDDELLGQMQVFVKMGFGSTRLSDEAFDNLHADVSKEMKEIFMASH